MSTQPSRARHARLLTIGAAVALATVGGSGIAATSALAAKPHRRPPLAAGRMLAGFTSQDLPVVLMMSADGNSVTRASATLDLRCGDAGGNYFPDDFTRLRLSAAGGSSRHLRLPPGSGGDSSFLGASDDLTLSVDRGRASFKGAWHLTYAFRETDGTTRRCDSGKVAISGRL